MVSERNRVYIGVASSQCEALGDALRDFSGCSLVPVDADEVVDRTDLSMVDVLLTDGLSEAFRRQLILYGLPSLRWLHTSYAGIGWIARCPDLQDRLRKVTVTNGRGIDAVPVAEWVIAVVLWHLNCIGEHVAHQQCKEWCLVEHRRISESVATILGTGAIGREVATRLSALGVCVRGVSAHGAKVEGVRHAYLRTDIGVAVGGCDLLVVCLPGTPLTRHIVGETELGLLNNGAFVVNVGRGSCIDEAALVQALRSRKISGAALDVFDEEPLPQSSLLWEMPGVLITPHNAWHDALRRGRTAELLLGNLTAYMDQAPLRNTVDVYRGY